MKRYYKSLIFFLALFLLVVGSYFEGAKNGSTQVSQEKKSPAGFDALISAHAQQMMEEGRRIFRFDTFGSEAFWGDALQLHKAIAGEKNGGVGGGVSPKTALAVG